MWSTCIVPKDQEYELDKKIMKVVKDGVGQRDQILLKTAYDSKFNSIFKTINSFEIKYNKKEDKNLILINSVLARENEHGKKISSIYTHANIKFNNYSHNIYDKSTMTPLKNLSNFNNIGGIKKLIDIGYTWDEASEFKDYVIDLMSSLLERINLNVNDLPKDDITNNQYHIIMYDDYIELQKLLNKNSSNRSQHLLEFPNYMKSFPGNEGIYLYSDLNNVFLKMYDSDTIFIQHWEISDDGSVLLDLPWYVKSFKNIVLILNPDQVTDAIW